MQILKWAFAIILAMLICFAVVVMCLAIFSHIDNVRTYYLTTAILVVMVGLIILLLMRIKKG
jgi:hypothetical protein